jgi:hypothetical protein
MHILNSGLIHHGEFQSCMRRRRRFLRKPSESAITAERTPSVERDASDELSRQMNAWDGRDGGGFTRLTIRDRGGLSRFVGP